VRHLLTVILDALSAMDTSSEFRKGLSISDLRSWILARYNDLHHGSKTFTYEQMNQAAELLQGGPREGFLMKVIQPS